MSAVADIPTEVVDRVLGIAKSHREMTITQQGDYFVRQLRRAKLNVSLLPAEERIRHIQAQSAVRAFNRERELRTPGFTLKDAARIVLTDAHGGRVGREKAVSKDFADLLAIYR